MTVPASAPISPSIVIVAMLELELGGRLADVANDTTTALMAPSFPSPEVSSLIWKPVFSITPPASVPSVVIAVMLPPLAAIPIDQLWAPEAELLFESLRTRSTSVVKASPVYPETSSQPAKPRL